MSSTFHQLVDTVCDALSGLPKLLHRPVVDVALGHCGRRLHVSYGGTDGYCVRYSCRGAHLNHGTRRCISFGGVRVDSAVAEEVLQLLSPLGMEASVEAVAMREDEVAETRRQYDAVDPQNRLVAAELERRWNERLAEVARQEERLAATAAVQPDALSGEDKERLLALGGDLETVWEHPGATAETRKRILRTVLEEIVATSDEDRIELLLHWRAAITPA